MPNLLALPSTRQSDSWQLLADWVELKAYFAADGNCSRADLIQAIRQATGVLDTSAEEKANAVFEELKDRSVSCAAEDGESVYPFSLNAGGDLLSIVAARRSRLSRQFLPYLFLLAVSRSEMNIQSRILNGHDPTKLFERLSENVLAELWGGRSAFSGAMVVGTSSTGDFRSKISSVCGAIGEGGGWKRNARAPRGGDGSVDLVAWRKFRDGRPGNLLGMAQCKTGEHWDDCLTEMNPKTYCRRFMQQMPLRLPTRIFFVPHRIDRERWERFTDDGGLLMDRCRIVQYSAEISTVVERDCRAWLSAAMRRQEQN